MAPERKTSSKSDEEEPTNEAEESGGEAEYEINEILDVGSHVLVF